MEASGTSGMKAAINGVLNMSIPDGWWIEGYQPDGGWVIGAGESYQDHDYQDLVESQAIYKILENDAVPLYYTRSVDNIPRAWLSRVRNSVRWVIPRFNTHRMVADYTRRFYNPAAARYKYLAGGDMEKAKAFAQWKSYIKQVWGDIKIKDVAVTVTNGKPNVPLNPRDPQLKVGSELNVRTLVNLGQSKPEDVNVQLYFGAVDSWGNIRDGSAVTMHHEAPKTDNEQSNTQEHWFSGSVACDRTGQYGVAVRILPKHPDMNNPQELGLVLWEAAK